MKVVLFQPEIPPNTGNIVRTCKVVGAGLVLINPQFSISNKHLKRAGLDYWDGVDVEIHADLMDYLEKTPHPFYFFSSRATTLYTEINYDFSSELIFGSETKGLPKEISKKWPEKMVKLPMKPDARCLNLSNAAAIALYEAWRQQSFSFPPR